MDEQRQIRFLYPPFVMLASLLWGIHLDPNTSLVSLLQNRIPSVSEWSGIIGIVLGGGTVVIAFGFVISTVSISVLRFIFLVRSLCTCRRWTHFEATVSSDCLALLWSKLGLPQPVDESKMLSVIVTFDHEKLPQRMHEWLRRRWSAFLISSHSVVALGFALFFGRHLNVAFTIEWIITSCILMLLFLWAAIAAWIGNMRMIELQSARDWNQWANSPSDKTAKL